MNGFFNLNKEVGISSAKAIWLLKKRLNLQGKIGHMGTLDPLAEGVLVVAVGRANRLFEFMLGKKKGYRAVFEFGFQTACLDCESQEIVARSEHIPTAREVKKVLPGFIGPQLQTAPAFSAKSIGGKRAYEFARKGEEVDIKPHRIEIYSIALLSQPSKTQFEFEIECSGGTYIRSICRDLAERLDSCATMVALRRTACGPFKISEAKSVEQITAEDLLKPDMVLDELPVLEINAEELQKIRNGLVINCAQNGGSYRVYQDGELQGLAQIDEQGNIRIKPWLI